MGPETLARTWPILLTLLYTSLTAAGSKASAPAEWQIIHKQSPSSKGSNTQPAIRYGHTCAAYQGQLVASHGYFYDRETHNVNWLSDTWMMSMTSPYKWKRLSSGINQETSLAYYQGQEVPPAPCGRFGHADTMLNHTLYMYGGHDGGYSRHGKQNYEPGHDFDELWSFDFETHRWSFIIPNNSYSPGRRYLAAITGVEDLLLLYGGMGEGQGDVWSFNVTSEEWEYLAPDEPRSETHPGRRVGHTLTPIQFPHGIAKGFILIGGRQIEADGSTKLATDSWFFDLQVLRWRKLAVDSGVEPSPRTYHAEAHTYFSVDRIVNEFKHANGVMVGMIVGGTTTTPSLTCTNDAWAFVTDCGVTALTWVQLPDLPVEVYDLRAAADPTAVYAYGGHLCALKEGYPFYYTNQVVRLEIKTLLKHFALHGCQVDRKQLKEEAPHAHGGTYDEL